MKVLMNLIRWTDVMVNMGSTVSIEAAVFDRPVVNVGFNRPNDSEVPMHHRISYAFDHTTHHQYVERTGGTWRVSNESELIGAVKAYLANPALHREGRSKIVEEVVGPLDGKAGEKTYKELLALAGIK